MLKWVLIPISLSVLGIILSITYFFNSDINPNIRSFNHKSSSIYAERGVIKGTITANDNFLSLLTVRFANTEVLSGNSQFRIKNVLDKDWYQVATISASNYTVIPQYVFGFPSIKKSKNQIYEFEIRMIDGSSGLKLSHKYPVLISQYQYPKSILLENKGLLVEFIIKKLSYYIYGETAWKVFAVYSIPFFLYLIYITFAYRFIPNELMQKAGRGLRFLFNPYMAGIFLCLFLDIFVIRKYSDSVTTLFTFLWILGVAAYRLESRHSFGAALLFLVFCPFLLSANMEWVAEKSAVWAYMFLAVGTFHAMFELKAEESSKVQAFLNFICNVLSFITHFDAFLLKVGRGVKRFALYSVQNFVKVIIIFIITSILFLLGFDLFLKALSYRDRQMKNPSFPLVEPTLVYPGTKVFLYGDRFGDNSNNKYALMKDGERIRVDYWEDHKIIFTVPLDWKPGEMKFWIEKPVEWNAETVIEKTKPITIKLLKVTGSFTPDDDLYFEQMKTWRKETKEINGYK